MSKRARRSRPTRPKQRTAKQRRPQRRREPDLVERIADALDADDPLELLEFASTLLDVVDHRSDDPFRPDPDRPTREQLLESLFGAPLSETSALLAAVAALSGDHVLRRRVSREIAVRAHALPEWLADVSKAVAEPEAVEVTHELGDADDIIVSVALPGEHPLTAVVLIDHNSGSIVKDAFVVPDPLDEIVATLRAARGSDSGLADRPLSPADAKVRITEAVERGARTIPPAETETWPACRPLVEWMTSLLPDGGTGYERRSGPTTRSTTSRGGSARPRSPRASTTRTTCCLRCSGSAPATARATRCAGARRPSRSCWSTGSRARSSRTSSI